MRPGPGGSGARMFGGGGKDDLSFKTLNLDDLMKGADIGKVKFPPTPFSSHTQSIAEASGSAHPHECVCGQTCYSWHVGWLAWGRQGGSLNRFDMNAFSGSRNASLHRPQVCQGVSDITSLHPAEVCGGLNVCPAHHSATWQSQALV